MVRATLVVIVIVIVVAVVVVVGEAVLGIRNHVGKRQLGFSFVYLEIISQKFSRSIPAAHRRKALLSKPIPVERANYSNNKVYRGPLSSPDKPIKLVANKKTSEKLEDLGDLSLSLSLPLEDHASNASSKPGMLDVEAFA